MVKIIAVIAGEYHIIKLRENRFAIVDPKKNNIVIKEGSWKEILGRDIK
ncbi:hypothetical protein ACFL0W_02400 [Nanoarchaeota archaeon]